MYLFCSIGSPGKFENSKKKRFPAIGSILCPGSENQKIQKILIQRFKNDKPDEKKEKLDRRSDNSQHHYKNLRVLNLNHFSFSFLFLGTTGRLPYKQCWFSLELVYIIKKSVLLEWKFKHIARWYRNCWLAAEVRVTCPKPGYSNHPIFTILKFWA